jgi:hypothetical protein
MLQRDADPMYEGSLKSSTRRLHLSASRLDHGPTCSPRLPISSIADSERPTVNVQFGPIRSSETQISRTWLRRVCLTMPRVCLGTREKDRAVDDQVPGLCSVVSLESAHSASF